MEETYEEILEAMRVETLDMDTPQVLERIKVHDFKWANSQILFNRRFEEVKRLDISAADDPKMQEILDSQLRIVHEKMALIDILVFKMESLV